MRRCRIVLLHLLGSYFLLGRTVIIYEEEALLVWCAACADVALLVWRAACADVALLAWCAACADVVLLVPHTCCCVALLAWCAAGVACGQHVAHVAGAA